jgi:hypothetical protein
MAAGPFVGMVKNIVLVCGVLCWVIGSLVDKLVNVSNQLGLGIDAVNTITWLVWIFRVFPFLYFLALGINYWVESNNQSTGRV